MKNYIIISFLISIFVHVSIYFLIQNKLVNIYTQPLNIKKKFVKANIKSYIKNKQNNHTLYDKTMKTSKIKKVLKTKNINKAEPFKQVFNNIEVKNIANSVNINNEDNQQNIKENIDNNNIETSNIINYNFSENEVENDIKNDDIQSSAIYLDVPKYLLSFNVYPRSYKVIFNLTNNITLLSFEVINNEKLDFLDNELKKIFEKKLKKDINMQNKELEWLYQKQKNGEHETTQILQFLVVHKW